MRDGFSSSCLWTRNSYTFPTLCKLSPKQTKWLLFPPVCAEDLWTKELKQYYVIQYILNGDLCSEHVCHFFFSPYDCCKDTALNQNQVNYFFVCSFFIIIIDLSYTNNLDQNGMGRYQYNTSVFIAALLHVL